MSEAGAGPDDAQDDAVAIQQVLDAAAKGDRATAIGPGAGDR